jgi:hypothetical protein
MRIDRDSPHRDLRDWLAYGCYFAVSFVAADAWSVYAVFVDARGIQFSRTSWAVQLVMAGIIVAALSALGSAGLWLALKGRRRLRLRIRHFAGAGTIFGISAAAIVIWLLELPHSGPSLTILAATALSLTMGLISHIWPTGTRTVFRFGSYIALPALWAVRFYLNSIRKTARHGCCSRCGYDLRESPFRCPECGAPIIRRIRKLPPAETIA